MKAQSSGKMRWTGDSGVGVRETLEGPLGVYAPPPGFPISVNK